jgi:hypothetical protein
MAVGVVDVGVFPANLQKRSFSNLITRLMPQGSASLFALTSLAKEETAIAPEHGYWSKTKIIPTMTLGAAVADGVVNIFTVDSTANVLPNKLYRAASTGEHFLIQSILSPTQVQVVRGVGSTAASISNSVKLYLVGSAFEEGSLRPQSEYNQPIFISNYTQIFRNSWGITRTAAAGETEIGIDNVSENRLDCAENHATDIEYALWFGKKATSIKNGKPWRLMDGVVNLISNVSYYPPVYAGVPNLFAAGSTTTYTQLANMLDQCFLQATDSKTGNNRVLFTGNTGKKVITDIARLNGSMQLTPAVTTYGMQIDTFRTRLGTFNLITHPLFNSNADWSAMAVALDLSTMNLAYLRGGKTVYKSYNMSGDTAQDNGVDAMGGTLTSELTLLMKNVPANAVITGFTAGAAG